MLPRQQSNIIQSIMLSELSSLGDDFVEGKDAGQRWPRFGPLLDIISGMTLEVCLGCQPQNIRQNVRFNKD